MLTAIRAAQCALFEHGWLLNTDERKLIPALSVRTARVLDEEVSAELRAYLRTSNAAAAAIRILTGAPVTAIAKLNLDAIAGDGSTITIAGKTYDVPEHARGILRAHRIHRLTEGATARAPLFLGRPRRKLNAPTERMGGHGLRRLLTRVGRECGFDLLGYGRPEAEPYLGWAARHGLTLKRIDDLGIATAALAASHTRAA
jgi:hypothetical protein